MSLLYLSLRFFGELAMSAQYCVSSKGVRMRARLRIQGVWGGKGRQVPVIHVSGLSVLVVPRVLAPQN